MITFNKIKFAQNDDEYQQDSSCLGFYKKMRNGIRLLDSKKNIFAFIVNNPYPNNGFIVSASMQDKQIRYMFSTTSQTDQLLGLDNLGYMAKHQECMRVINEVS